jgi:hypothetical protein
VLGADARLGSERGDRLRDAPGPGTTTAREGQTLDGPVEELGRLLRPLGPPSFDALTRGGDSPTHWLRRLRRRGGELSGTRARHRYNEVEAIEQGA